MNNALWRLDPDNLAGYTEDIAVVRKIRRSHPSFTLMATYTKGGVTYGWQFRIPSQKKRTARRLLGVNVEQ